MDLGNLDEVFTDTEIGGEDIFAAVILVIIGFALSYFIGRWSRRYIGRIDDEPHQLLALMSRVAQVLVIAVFVGWALTRLGADIGWLTVMAVVALLIGVLAARPILEGLGASAALTTRPAFSVGDEIGVDDAVGEVVEITSRSTVIRLRDGRRVHIPNVEMLSKTVTVYTAEDERRSAVAVTIGFEVDPDRAESVLRSALEEIDGITRVGSIRAKALTDGIELSVRFWHPSNLQAGNDAADAAVRAIKTALRAEGLRFAPPIEVRLSQQVNDNAPPE